MSGDAARILVETTAAESLHIRAELDAADDEGHRECLRARLDDKVQIGKLAHIVYTLTGRLDRLAQTVKKLQEERHG